MPSKTPARPELTPYQADQLRRLKEIIANHGPAAEPVHQAKSDVCPMRTAASSSAHPHVTRCRTSGGSSKRSGSSPSTPTASACPA